MIAEIPPPHDAPLLRPLDHYWDDERSRRLFVDELFDRSAGGYDQIERILALGSGSWYRRHALRRAGLRSGMRVLDIATGTGLVAREALAIAGPAGSVIGLDPSAGMLEQAGRELSIPLVRAYGEQLPCRDACFDFVSMGFALRHVCDLRLLFREMRRVLKPGGALCLLEITRPNSRAAAAVLETFVARIVPAFVRGAKRRDEARRLMRFYWDTIDACVSPEVILRALAAAGLTTGSRSVSLGIFSEYVAVNPATDSSR